ncbi:MAG TPA: ATP-binding protein [Ktedonobacterales bacterium]|nr:ATP-binding protein [Ktedonobacterales bacterium]
MPIEVLLGALAGGIVASVGWWVLLRWSTSEREEAVEGQERARRRQSQIEEEMLALEHLFAGMLDAVPRPVFVTNRDRVILQVNRAAVELAHLPRHQVVGRIVATVIQDYDTTVMLMESAKSGQSQEKTIQRAATGETWKVVVTPLRLGSVGGVFALDGTTNPNMKATRGTSPEMLPTHLVLTIEDLTRLHHLETVRRDFVANVSHELRTPLASVKLLAETVQTALDHDPEAARTFAQRIEAEVDSLSQLVAELLELSRIESGRAPLRLAPTDLREVLAETVVRVENLAELQGVHLGLAWENKANLDDCEPLPLALADGPRIGQVLLNLIHNAIKFTPKDGTITVGVRRTPDDPQSLTVWVRDTGVGISEDDLARIFERFYKVDRARTRGMSDAKNGGEPGGTGLGLAIARHVVEQHEGRIWAESKPGRGSVFSFTLPIAQENAAPDAPETPREQEARTT